MVFPHCPHCVLLGSLYQILESGYFDHSLAKKETQGGKPGGGAFWWRGAFSKRKSHINSLGQNFHSPFIGGCIRRGVQSEIDTSIVTFPKTVYSPKKNSAWNYTHSELYLSLKGKTSVHQKNHAQQTAQQTLHNHIFSKKHYAKYFDHY